VTETPEAETIGKTTQPKTTYVLWV